jgi:hypothetical protein
MVVALWEEVVGVSGECMKETAEVFVTFYF